jgi:hypothetical protein
LSVAGFSAVLPDFPVQNFLMWHSEPVHGGVMRVSCPIPII